MQRTQSLADKLRTRLSGRRHARAIRSAVLEALESRRLLTAVTDFSYDPNTAPHRFTFTYSTNVGEGFTLENFRLHRVGVNAGADEPASKFNEGTFNPGTNTATINAAYLASETSGFNNILPDSNYDLTPQSAGERA